MTPFTLLTIGAFVVYLGATKKYKAFSSALLNGAEGYPNIDIIRVAFGAVIASVPLWAFDTDERTKRDYITLLLLSFLIANSAAFRKSINDFAALTRR